MSERSDVELDHVDLGLNIGFCKRSYAPESGVIDEDVDGDSFFLETIAEDSRRVGLRQIHRENAGGQNRRIIGKGSCPYGKGDVYQPESFRETMQHCTASLNWAAFSRPFRSGRLKRLERIFHRESHADA